MAVDNRLFIFNILEDLSLDEMNKLGVILKGKKPENYEASLNKLENLNAHKATALFISSYEKPLQALKSSLDDIPRKDLTQKISTKIEADMKNKDEAQNNEKFALIKPSPGSSDRPPYTGKYTLFDLQDYVTKNQDQLIMHLENILKPDEFNALKKELMCSVLNKGFSFTAQKYYELFKNGELKEFLKNISGESKKIPMKLLNVLFSKKKNNYKIKAQEQMQREGNNINLKKKQLVNIDDGVANVPDKVGTGMKTLGIENEKTVPIHPIEPKQEGWMRGKEEHGNEDNNVIGEHWLDEDSRMAIKNWYEKKKKNNYRERISLNYVCIHEHQTYPCFTAQDVLQFRLPGDPDYRILAILQDKRDFTSSRKLKKEVEFALQFNMAVLAVQFSEVISSSGFLCEIQANDSFAESEFFLKNIVFEVVLPVLALYKQVKLNAFKNAVYPNKESC